MLQALKDYFKSRGILSTHFRCEHSDSCAGCLAKDHPDWEIDLRFAREDSGDGDTRPCPKCGTPMDRAWRGKKACRAEGCGYFPRFTGPKSSYVGTGYERSAGFARGGLPRLLILSPDSGGETWDARSKTPESIRRWEERATNDVANYGEKDQDKHWYRTYELAWYILRVFDPKFKAIGNVKGHFAHVNAAKCSLNNYANREADDQLAENCREHLAGELQILRPDIVVTQGRTCERLAVRHLYRGRIRQIEGELAWVQMNDAHRFLWLWTFHPTSRPPAKGELSPFKKQADFDASETARGWVRYSQRIHQLLEETQGG